MNARAWAKHEHEVTHQAMYSKMEKLTHRYDSHILWHENLKPIVDEGNEKLERLIAESETGLAGMSISAALNAHFLECRDDVYGLEWLEDTLREEGAKIANLLLMLLKSIYFQVFLRLRQLAYFEHGMARIALVQSFVVLPNIKIHPPPLELRPQVQPMAEPFYV
jgi:hypothetical protein